MQSNPQPSINDLADTLHQHAIHYQNQIQAVNSPLPVASRTDLGFDAPGDPLGGAANAFKTSLNVPIKIAAGAEVKLEAKETQSMADALDTHLRQQVNSLIQAVPFDQAAWDAGINAARSQLKTLYETGKAALNNNNNNNNNNNDLAAQQDALKKWYQSAQQKLDEVNKKLSDEMVALGRSLYGLYVSRYLTNITTKIPGYQEWKLIQNPGQPLQQAGLQLGAVIDFSKDLAEGFYTRANDPSVGIVCKKNANGVTTASISKKGAGTPSKNDYEKLIDFMVTQGRSTQLTIGFDHPELADSNTLKTINQLITIAEAKRQPGIPFYLEIDPAVLRGLYQHGRSSQEIQPLIFRIAQHNQIAKTLFAQAPVDLSHQARLKQLDADIKIVTDQTSQALLAETKDTLIQKVTQLDQSTKSFESAVVSLRKKVIEFNAANAANAANSASTDPEIVAEYGKLSAWRAAIEAEKTRLLTSVNAGPPRIVDPLKAELTTTLTQIAALSAANNNNNNNNDPSLLKNDIAAFATDAQNAENARLHRQP